ncbi:hypothetical protein ACFYMW_39280 [Streptomyces sp. NPDC006692]
MDPWTDHGDAAVRIGERGLERGRPLLKQEPDINLDTEAVLTGTLHCAKG